MSPVQTMCLKFVFSAILVVGLAEVSSFTDAAPSDFIADVFDPKSIEETNADDSTTYYAARGLETDAPPKPKRSDKMKAQAKEGLKKLKETTQKIITASKGAYNKHIGSKFAKGKKDKPAAKPAE